MPKIRIHGSTFDTDAHDIIEVFDRVCEALVRFPGVKVLISPDQEGVNVFTDWPNEDVNKMFSIEWSPEGDVNNLRNPQVSFHSSDTMFYLSNAVMVAMAAKALLMPSTRLLLPFDGFNELGSETVQAFAITDTRIRYAKKAWVIEHPTHHNIFIDAAHWERGGPDIPYSADANEGMKPIRKLNINWEK